MEEFNENAEVEAFRKSVARRILLESDRLVDSLFSIVYGEDVEAKVKLSAISLLLDRAIPKKGVEHVAQDETEERGSRKAIREELERLLLDEEDDDGLEGNLN